jgi:hypothetical protein
MSKFLTEEIRNDAVYSALTAEDLTEAAKFPTKKPHISYSEVSTWDACQLQHWIAYVLGLSSWEENPYADLGTCCHGGAEQYINTRTLDIEAAQVQFDKRWAKHIERYSDETIARLMKQYKVDSPDGVFTVYRQMIHDILVELPAFMDATYPGWEPVNAEEILYEQIPNDDIRFKGYIDAVIKCKNKRGKELIWLIDWKTCGWGWTIDQKRDIMKAMQLGFYKIYYAAKHDIDLKDIRCAFVLLKRDGKLGKRIEQVTVSVGPKSIDRANLKTTQMLTAVRKGFRFKNRKNCRWCPWRQTEHCP